MAQATKTRHPGRRKPASDAVRTRHLKSIGSGEKKRRDYEQKASEAMTTLAKRIDSAMQDGVETQAIAEQLGCSRQMVYKLVRERVDGKPLGKKGANPFSRNGNKKG